jgi:hypothetical protein
MKKNDKRKIEEDLNQLLTEGELNKEEPDKRVIKDLSPRYEIRIQAEKDPIKEETEIVQRTVIETNKRYLKYVETEGNQGNVDNVYKQDKNNE